MKRIARDLLTQVRDMVPGRFEIEVATDRTHPHLATHFDHGVAVQTTTAEAAALWDVPEFIVSRTLSYDTPFEQVVRRHHEVVSEYRKLHPSQHPIVIKTLMDVTALSDAIVCTREFRTPHARSAGS